MSGVFDSRGKAGVVLSLGRNPHPIPGQLQRQNASPVVSDGSGYPAGAAFIDQKNHASPTPCSTDFGRASTVLCGNRDQLINQWRGNTRRISAAELPFFMQ